MKIIGGHDYYDSAQSYGYDPKTVFIRSATEVKEQTFKRRYAQFHMIKKQKANSKNVNYRHRVHNIQTKNGSWHLYVRRVIFCGKMYTGVECSFIQNWSTLIKHPNQVFWNENDLQIWLDKFEVVFVKEKSWKSEDNVIFKPIDIVDSEYEYLINNRIANALYDYNKEKWTINCFNLQDVQFYRVFAAVQAFQELDMWISGTLGATANPMIEIDQKYRMEKHGMDKWSFRKKVR